MKQKQFKDYIWIDFENPTKEDIEFIEKKFNFHHLALEDCISDIQRPKVDLYDDHLFMVFHFPKHIKELQRTTAYEIDVFIGKSFIITLHKQLVKPLDELFEEVEGSKSLQTDTPSMLLYEILDKTFNYCFPMLDKISEKLNSIEDSLYRDHARDVLEKIAFLEHDIINFRRIINPQRYVIKDLENMKSKYLDRDTDIYFGDIADKIERIWDLLDNYREVSEVLQHTSESILTHRLNEIIKILTIFSVIMLPLTVITGFYGMNVKGLPFANHSMASWIVAGFLLIIVAVMLTWFVRKKWIK